MHHGLQEKTVEDAASVVVVDVLLFELSYDPPDCFDGLTGWLEENVVGVLTAGEDSQEFLAEWGGEDLDAPVEEVAQDLEVLLAHDVGEGPRASKLICKLLEQRAQSLEDSILDIVFCQDVGLCEEGKDAYG